MNRVAMAPRDGEPGDYCSPGRPWAVPHCDNPSCTKSLTTFGAPAQKYFLNLIRLEVVWSAAMTSLFTLLRALLAVLLVSTGYCNAAEFTAAPEAPAVSAYVSGYSSDGSHCEAHCDFRAMSLVASRDLIKPDLAKALPPVVPILTTRSVGLAQPRAPPLDHAHDDGRTAVDDLRTVRLLI